jgi:DNA replication protein DnaC
MVRPKSEGSTGLVKYQIGRRYRHATLESFELYGTADEQQRQQAVVNAVRDCCNNIRLKLMTGTNVILHGPPGGGKDFLMTCLMREAVLHLGAHVEWTNGLDLFGAFRDSFDSRVSESDLINTYAGPAAHVLAISDPVPSQGALTEFQAGTLFRIIDRRYRRDMPTWLTVNVDGRGEAAARMGEQVVDRLRGGALVLACNWPSDRSREGT